MNARILALVALGAVGLACDGATPASEDAALAPEDASEAVDGGDLAPSPAVVGADVLAADAAFFASFGRAAESLAGAGIPDGDDGLIGRNADWGELYSPRFQLGAGFSLRMTLAADEPTLGARAFRAVEVGLRDIEPDGRLPSRLPDSVVMGETVSEANVASGAAFFLGDVCLAMLALEASATRDAVAASERRDEVSGRLGRATTWLRTRTAELEAVDANAPNRLFHDALAFFACGVLAADEASLAEGRRFAELAMAMVDPAGHYIEGGGADTNYQAVAVEVALQLQLAGFESEAPVLADQLAEAVRWLADRVTDDGRVDSTGNTRTCGGCETFLPGDPPKEVGVSHMIKGLAYGAPATGVTDASAAASRFIEWLTTADPTTTCFERDDEGTLVEALCSMP